MARQAQPHAPAELRRGDANRALPEPALGRRAPDPGARCALDNAGEGRCHRLGLHRGVHDDMLGRIIDYMRTYRLDATTQTPPLCSRNSMLTCNLAHPGTDADGTNNRLAPRSRACLPGLYLRHARGPHARALGVYSTGTTRRAWLLTRSYLRTRSISCTSLR